MKHLNFQLTLWLRETDSIPRKRSRGGGVIVATAASSSSSPFFLAAGECHELKREANALQKQILDPPKGTLLQSALRSR